jgi:general stress protein 26
MKIIHTTPGMGALMDEQELRNFLFTSKQNCRLATIDEFGDPNVHPVWFHYEPQSKKIYMNTNIDSRKVLNIKRRNAVYFLH